MVASTILGEDEPGIKDTLFEPEARRQMTFTESLALDAAIPRGANLAECHEILLHALCVNTQILRRCFHTNPFRSIGEVFGYGYA